MLELRAKVNEGPKRVFIAYHYGREEKKWKKMISDALTDASFAPVDCDAVGRGLAVQNVKDTIEKCDAFIGIISLKNYALPAWVLFEAGIAVTRFKHKEIFIFIDEAVKTVAKSSPESECATACSLFRTMSGEIHFKKTRNSKKYYAKMITPVLEGLFST